MIESEIFRVLPILLFLLVFILLLHIQSKKLSQTPRKIRSSKLKMSYISLCMGLIIIGVCLFNQEHYWFIPMGIFFILTPLFTIYTPQTENDTKANYARDPGHCGRCEYDLTGNASGICPECGWEIPQGPIQYERPEWACWWMQWQIDYLDNWKRRLANIIIITIILLAAIIWFTFYMWNPFISIIFVLMGINMLITCYRIIAYGRRQG